jgi:hypothetical protein
MMSAKGQPVVAHVQGTTLRGGEISFDQAASRFHVPTPGDLARTIDRDLDGQRLETPLPLTVSWHGTLTFDGRQATLTDRVHIRTPQQQLQTQQLVASLTRPVSLETMQVDPQMDLDRLIDKVECLGGVILDRQTVDAGGLASQEHAELPNLTIERGLGQVSATGPGWLRSARLARGGPLRAGTASGRTNSWTGTFARHPMSRPADASQLAAGPSRGGTRGHGLSYLRVDFQRAMRGHLERREMRFDGQIRCVQGPVSSWNQVLHVEGLPQLPQDTFVLQSATLQVAQRRAPGGAAWHEMEAEGNVQVEGGLGEHGIFTARGSRLTYDQSKDLLILDGGAGMAELVREESLGGRRQQNHARAVHFSPSRNYAEFKEVHQFSGDF